MEKQQKSFQKSFWAGNIWKYHANARGFAGKRFPPITFASAAAAIASRLSTWTPNWQMGKLWDLLEKISKILRNIYDKYNIQFYTGTLLSHIIFESYNVCIWKEKGPLVAQTVASRFLFCCSSASLASKASSWHRISGVSDLSLESGHRNDIECRKITYRQTTNIDQ